MLLPSSWFHSTAVTLKVLKKKMQTFTYGNHEATRDYKRKKNSLNSPKIFPLQSVQSTDLMTTDASRSLIWEFV